MLSLVRVVRMTALLKRMLDENEFLSPYGIRALSRSYLAQPYRFECQGAGYQVHYLPAESDSELSGGNSNWRGPIWMPVNYLLIQSCLLYTSGVTSRTITPAAECTVGVRTVSVGFAMTSKRFVWPWRCGMARTRFSRNGCFCLLYTSRCV